MIGRPHVHYRRTDSTNERAKALGAAGAPHGTLVTADEQSAGRGRQGRAWTAPPRSALLMSLLLRDVEERHAVLPLAAGVAVCQACESLLPVRCSLKWPNDVWVDRRKLAGILIEGRPQEGWAVLGIGLNVSTSENDLPEELRDTATSLAMAAGAPPPSAERLLEALLSELADRLAQQPDRVLEAWRARDALLGQPVGWGQGQGRAAGIDDSGALLVDTPGGRVALDAGEVHLLRAG